MKIAWHLPIYQNHEQAYRALVQLRTLHPFDVITVTQDGGDPEPELEQRIRELARFQKTPRLKLWQCGGLWTAHYLSRFLSESDAKVLIKIDPDTWINDSINPYTLPSSDVFGDIQSCYGKPQVTGWSIGFHRRAVVVMLASGILYDERYSNTKYSYKDGVSLQDQIVMDVINRLDLTFEHWEENGERLRDGN